MINFSWNCAQAKTYLFELQTYYELTSNSWISYLVGALAIGNIWIFWCFKKNRKVYILVGITTLANWIAILKHSLDHLSIFCLYTSSLLSMGAACITILISLSKISSHRYLKRTVSHFGRFCTLTLSVD